jgi:hypothetical protein
MKSPVTFIRDQNAKIIGTVIEAGHTERIMNEKNIQVGVYNKTTNCTFGKNNSLVGMGNQLMRLLEK